MNYAGIKKTDIANCIGVGVSLYVSGCKNHCKGCFNPETWDFKYGNEFTKETLEEVLDACDKPYIKTLTILGGDPMEKENRKQVLEICESFRERFKDSKQLWLYTGYYFENLIREEDSLRIIKGLDVIIDSPFQLENKVVDLKLRGSKNQRIIDVTKSLCSGDVVLYDIY